MSQGSGRGGGRIEPGPGQESVWDYPRPPRLEPCAKEVVVRFAGREIARSRGAFRVLETSHPPTIYVPPQGVLAAALVDNPRRSSCEWKGQARYVDVVGEGGQRAEAAGWSYPQPTDAFAAIRDFLAFYPSAMEACFLDGEQVQAQEGDFYGGWITRDIVGPFKGAAGTWGW